ncbi:hypothetical protein [Sphingomonas qomolangmaensis]|uniref:Uncharacterized protein n=1 Tax=Sphingomonas qomolangmaensis TaxID=2918765 RepID=A0ABY5L934_9SPHN|nr:hypothetical protein [Sphingomonas qomolangmaensis]UUL82229.1 hypothetical protein NMP03_13735 [Sphingomonas qomolangmaensis]
MPQHDDEFERIRAVIEMAQRLNTSLHAKLVDKGVAPIDALIAGTYALHQLATKFHGDPIAAVEWLRDAIDTIEGQAMGGGRVPH